MSLPNDHAQEFAVPRPVATVESSKLTGILVRTFALLLALTLTHLAPTGAFAFSADPTLRNVDHVFICVEKRGDKSARRLVDIDALQNSMVEYLTDGLRPYRSEVRISSDAGKGSACREWIDLDAKTLAVLVIITGRETMTGAGDWPCCFGAIAVRYDRDALRRNDDEYRLTFAPEPVFLGDDRGEALERAKEALKPHLDGLISVLNKLPPTPQ